MIFRDIIYGIIVLLLLFLLGWQTINRPSTTVVKEVRKQDTIIRRDTIKIETKARIVYRTKYIPKAKRVDSATTETKEVDSTAFVACFDTTIKKTSISTCYFYPENKFEMLVRFAPDTITKYTIIEKPIPQREQRSNWYVEALKIGGCFVLGVVLGASLK